MALSPKSVSLDVTRDNRAFVSQGDEIRVGLDSGKFTTAYRAVMPKDSMTFSPRKISLHDNAQRLLMLTPNKQNVVVFTDTETGKPLSLLGLDLLKDTAASPIKTFSHGSKFGRLQEASTVELRLASGNQVVEAEFDPRIKPNADGVHVNVIKNLDDEKQSRPTFDLPQKVLVEDIATTAHGDLVTAGTDGVIRLHSEAGKRSTTNFDQYSGVPVVGIDVSADGEWVLYTTAKFLGLINTKFKNDKGATSSGFKTNMGKHKKAVMQIRLTPQDLKDMGITEDDVNFTTARFDNGPVTGHPDIIEKYVVTSSGPFTIQWNMRHIEDDFKHQDERPPKARAQIYRNPGTVQAQLFDFDNSNYGVVSALEADLRRLKF